MIPPNVEPTAETHQSPYKRIDLYGPKPDAKGPDASVAEREQQLKDSDRIWRLIRKASGDDVPEPEPVPVPEPEPSFDYYDYGYFG